MMASLYQRGSWLPVGVLPLFAINDCCSFVTATVHAGSFECKFSCTVVPCEGRRLVLTWRVGAQILWRSPKTKEIHEPSVLFHQARHWYYCWACRLPFLFGGHRRRNDAARGRKAAH